MDTQDTKAPEAGMGLVWGAAAIGKEINASPRQTFYLLQKGLIPARKVGDQWVASREELRRHFSTSRTEAA